MASGLNIASGLNPSLRNRNYPYYEIDKLEDLRELLSIKNEKSPHKTAFMYFTGDDGSIEKKTYAEVYRDVSAMGNWVLRNRGQGRMVGVTGGNCYEWLLVFLAVANTGNTVVAVDAELPGDDMVKLFGQGDADSVFASAHCAEKLRSSGYEGDIVTFDSIAGILNTDCAQPADGPGYEDVVLDRDKCCCILFTSGTSGLSKGVMLSHRNFAFDIVNSCRLYKLDGPSAAVLPFHHAFGLVVGGFMVFHYGWPEFINKSLKTVKQCMQVSKPAMLSLVPLFVESFHKQIWKTAEKEGRASMLKRAMKVSDGMLAIGVDMRRTMFADVRKAFGGDLEYIICGGAELNPALIREFRTWGVEILNGYGTTECSPVVGGNRNFFHRDGSVGQPLPDSEVKISADGEVLVRGDHVMLGYYKDPEATEEAFWDGWYRTGDLGKIDKDGFVTLTGRKKNLIILSNGENISPEEIEMAYMKDPGVCEVMVYAEKGRLTAEIYPEEEYAGKTDYFSRLTRSINARKPAFKRIIVTKVRDTEFAKNGSKKIIRYRT